MAMKQLLFGRPAFGSAAADAGLLVLRVVAGLSIALLHGLGKVPPSEGFAGMVEGIGFPAPGLFAWLAALAEFGGGLLLAAGLLTRPVGALLVGHFTLVALMAHAGDPISDRELPILFWAVGLHFLLTGAGRYSLDAVIHGNRR